MVQLRSASRTTLTRIVGTFFATVLSATAAFAQATPHGGQFQVNTFTPNSQQRPAVAFDAQGQLVAVWKSFGDFGDPFFSVQGQRYSASGLAQGTQFQVNSSTSGFQGLTGNLTCDANGDCADPVLAVYKINLADIEAGKGLTEMEKVWPTN